MLIAFREPTSPDAVRALLASPKLPGGLEQVARATAAALRVPCPAGLPFSRTIAPPSSS